MPRFRVVRAVPVRLTRLRRLSGARVARGARTHRAATLAPALLAVATLATAARAAPAPCALAPGRAGTVDDYLGAALDARQKNDTATSLACLSHAYTLEPSAGLLHNIARLFEDLGRYREAAEAYRRLARAPGLDPALATADAARLGALTPRLDRAWIRAAIAPGVEARIDDMPLPANEEREHAPGAAVLEVLSGDVLHVARLDLAAGVRRDLALPLPESPSEGTIVLAAGTRTLTLDGRALVTPLTGVTRLRVDGGGHALSWATTAGVEERRAITLAPGETWIAAPTPETARWVPWVGGATTLALGATGGVFLALAEADRQTIADAARDDDGVVTGITFAEADRLDARAGDRTTMGVAFLIGASIALAGTAVAWWLTDAP